MRTTLRLDTANGQGLGASTDLGRLTGEVPVAPHHPRPLGGQHGSKRRDARLHPVRASVTGVTSPWDVKGTPVPERERLQRTWRSGLRRRRTFRKGPEVRRWQGADGARSALARALADSGSC